jgi:Fe-S-cluster containining protein
VPLLVLGSILAVHEHDAVIGCSGCGACCREQTVPPFLDEIDLIPRDLQAEVYAARGVESLVRPCIWFDVSSGKCRHYEHRPNVCREFETGGDCCLETRERFGIFNSSRK